MISTSEILQNAKQASFYTDLAECKKKDALYSMADSLILNTSEILTENKKDIDNARDSISGVMIDRLSLDKNRITAMAQGIRSLATLTDPVGRELSNHTTDTGLNIRKITVPIGVIAIIYESRPNVTSDAAALCFKSGNVAILRSGKEAFLSASAIVKALRQGLSNCGLPENYINLIEDTSRESAKALMNAVGYVDLLIPRGGKGLITACTNNAKVPCIQTGTGICHIFVEKSADIEKALNIIENAKASRPSVCNAAEVCLVDKSIADTFLPKLAERFNNTKYGHSVEIRGDKEVCKIIPVKAAEDIDFDTEFLDYIMAVKIVDNIDEAIEHISKHSTHHSDAIIAEDKSACNLFTKKVDSAAVYVNASTRFTDGGEFGLGCEMGISTQKLHARGPMGLQELTTYKYIVTGNGNIR